MIKAWLLDEMFRFDRAPLSAEGNPGEWGAGDSIAEEEELPPAPANVAVKAGNGRLTVTWDPVPDAMYYNLYFQTTKGVQIKFSELTRPIASADDFKAVIGVKKDKGTCLEGAQSPFVHDDLANGTCYHYVVTVVTPKGESLESQEVMAIPAPYLLAMNIGAEGVDDGEFSSPTGIALDKEGNIYVADTDNHSIQKFDKTGKFIARWGGEPSSQEGSFYYPRGLAVGANDTLYVSDSGNNRVQKFDLEGNAMQAWGKFGFAWRGAEMGVFDVPWGVATDQEGNLYVSDTSNSRIQKFKADGTPLLKWGRDGSFDGAFFFPRGVAVDFVGNIFVADESNNRIQKFDARGSFLSKWGREGSGPGQFKAPWGVACDAVGNVYVVDTGNHRIQKFDGNGTFLCAWGNRGKTEGQFNFPYGIAVDKEGCVYVVDSGNNRVLKYVPTDEELSRGNETPAAQESVEAPAPHSVVVKAGDTEIFVSWMEVPRAVSYNLYFNTTQGVAKQTGTKIEGVTNPFTHTGLTNDTPYFYAVAAVFENGTESELSAEVTAMPVLIDVTAPQNPYAVINHGAFMTNSPEVVVTISANDVDTGVGAYFISEAPLTPMGGTPGWVDVTPALKFGATIPFILSLGDGPKTIYVWFKDIGGNVSTPASATILVNTSGYLCVAKWGRPGRGASLLHGGEFMAPMYGMAVDQQGSLFVVDNGNNRIQKFDNTGNFIILWGNFGSANSNFHNPTGIACDGKGDVWAVDTNNHRVQKFDGKLGGYIMKFGSRGNGEGQFNSPWGIAVDRVRGYVYVVDSANFRVQKFDMAGEFVMSWGSFGNGDGQFYFPRGVAVDQSDGSVYVVDMGNHRVQKFDTSTNVLPQLLTKWGGSSEPGHASSQLAQEAGQLRSPWGVAVDGAGDVYVTDTGNHRVEKFDKEGNFITQWGGYGNGDGQFNFPYGLAVDAKGSVFVVDSGNTRVQQFMPSDEGSERLQEESEAAAEIAKAQGATSA
ncbi:putative NHL repeat protein [Nitrospira japonica]|uniref:Putative NHL repeat protein n=1 Tax=Nitrospira japonica TaxID=1325564 RepID=A0A1W1I6P8_9BACT|nr:6-bladed beta-propeller [Nitrospira japonica]SLM48655.1 putative NHL repeat protein [Nitrospira japonica]